MVRAPPPRARREAAAQRSGTVGGAAVAAAADDETKQQGEPVAAQNVRVLLEDSSGIEAGETKGGGGAEPGSGTTPGGHTVHHKVPRRKHAKATGKNRLAKQIRAFFSSLHDDDDTASQEEQESDNGEVDDEGALPDPADRGAFKAYTEMIIARECIAVVARRAELTQAVGHLEVTA
jgi:hypothetical protein